MRRVRRVGAALFVDTCGKTAHCRLRYGCVPEGAHFYGAVGRSLNLSGASRFCVGSS
jgi:hypothetical protein